MDDAFFDYHSNEELFSTSSSQPPVTDTDLSV